MKNIDFNILFVNNTYGNYQDMNKLRLLLVNNLASYFDNEMEDCSISIQSKYKELRYVNDIIKEYKSGNYNYIFGMFDMSDLVQFKDNGLLGRIIVPKKDVWYDSLESFRIIIDILKTNNNPIKINGLITISKDIPIKEYY